MKSQLLRQLETLGTQLQVAKSEHEAQQKFLAGNETHTQLEKQTKKLAAQEQTIYQLQDCALLLHPWTPVLGLIGWWFCADVSSRAAGSDYGQTKENVINMSRDLNTMCVHALKLH